MMWFLMIGKFVEAASKRGQSSRAAWGHRRGRVEAGLQRSAKLDHQGAGEGDEARRFFFFCGIYRSRGRKGRRQARRRDCGIARVSGWHWAGDEVGCRERPKMEA